MVDRDTSSQLVLASREITVVGRIKELDGADHGRVYAVSYCEMIWAAKEIHSFTFEDRSETEKSKLVDLLIRECHQCSRLRHPNVIQFLGVYYPEVDGVKGVQLPVMVMEMMADSLSSFVEKYQNIPAHIKFSIIHDVSLGLCYLHHHDPQIVHGNLHSNNVLLTEYHRAKISDLGVTKVINADNNRTRTVDFMPPESLESNYIHNTPMDIFAFAGIVLHTFNECWPKVQINKSCDSVTRSEVERRQQYLDKMSGEGEVLRPLVEECLDDDPAVRPTIATVCKKIQSSKVYSKSTSSAITLHQKIEKMNSEMEQQQNEILHLKTTVKEMEKLTKVCKMCMN